MPAWFSFLCLFLRQHDCNHVVCGVMPVKVHAHIQFACAIKVHAVFSVYVVKYHQINSYHAALLCVYVSILHEFDVVVYTQLPVSSICCHCQYLRTHSGPASLVQCFHCTISLCFIALPRPQTPLPRLFPVLLIVV